MKKEFHEVSEKKKALNNLNVSFDKSILLKNIYYNYPKNKNFVFSDLNFQLNKFESVGLMKVEVGKQH